MRLIDADALIKGLNNSHFPGAPYVDAGISIAIGKVCDAPTIEPEQKTGKWVRYDGDWLKTMCKCSECGAMIDINEKYRNFFCYHCGAKMDGEQE